MRNDFQSDAQKDPDELEREVNQQREYINETLSALERKFSPGQIFDQVLSYTRGGGGEFTHNLMDTVKANPMPTLLTATGLAWLIAGQNRSGRSADSYLASNASYGVDPAYQSKGGDGSGKLKGKAQESKEKARHRMENMRSSAQHSAERTREQMQHARENMRYQAQRAGQGFDHMLKEQPLALGALGIALGALIGASIPQTRKENEALGETRDRVAEKAKQAAEENVEKAKEVGSKVAEDAKQEAQQAARQSSDQSSTRPGGTSYPH